MRKIFIVFLFLLAPLLTLFLASEYFTFSSTTPPSNSNPQKITQFSEQLQEQVLPFRELTIPYLREQEFPGSEITIEERLAGGSGYSRYRASYQSEGLRIYGLLTVPAGDPPPGGWPAIVFLHGYIPPTQYQTTERYVGYVDSLARNGFVVFKIDYRGHDESEGEPTGAYYGSGYVADTLNALASLQQYEPVHPDKIGLWGHSMSGNVALRSMVINQNIKAGVIWAGAVYSYDDMQKYGLNDNSYVRRTPSPSASPSDRRLTRQRISEVVGEFSPTATFWKELAPTNYLSAEMGALQIHHAINDPVVSINYTRDLKPLLEEANVEHEIYEYQTGGHDIEGSSFSTAMQRTVEFFQTHLNQENS